MTQIPETPKSWIQAVISIAWFAIFGVVAVIMTVGLVQHEIELTVYLSVVGIYGSISGTIILWLFKSANENTAFAEVKDFIKLINDNVATVMGVRVEYNHAKDVSKTITDQIKAVPSPPIATLTTNPLVGGVTTIVDPNLKVS
jgi:hypothetical protein